MAALNNAGGEGFAMTDAQRMIRFLILGSEGGTYYTTERKLTLENASAIHRLIVAGRGEEVVATLVDVSTKGRASKQSPTLFALAMVARYGNENERHAAYGAIPLVCRTPTMLFEFIGLRMAMAGDKGKGWGNGMRRAIAAIYGRDPSDVAFAATKYRQRDGWTHRDVLRLAHVKPSTDAHEYLFRYIVTGVITEPSESAESEGITKLKKFLHAVELARAEGTSENLVIKIIKKFRLGREHIHTSMLSSCKVWCALLENMPLTALIRNLGKMTSIGLLTKNSEETATVVRKLTDMDALKRARVHPLTILFAMKTYDSCHGEKGKLTWFAEYRISSALEKAFYLAFGNVEPTGKRYLLGLDVSGSMDSGGVGGTSLTPRDASAAMAMVTMRTEACRVMGFSHQLVPLPISNDDDLARVARIMSSTPMGGTDCALPMTWALKNRVPVDVFVVYTDCETWVGRITPAAALREYRAKMGIDACLIVVAMTSGGFSIADPEDNGMLDVVGFDTSTPQIMREFVMGNM